MSKIFLQFINKMLWPYVLGTYSENNGGSFVVINKANTRLRSLGSSDWSKWTISHPNSDNRCLQTATADEVDRSALISILSQEAANHPISPVKNVRISSFYAFFSNPVVTKGKQDIREGDEFKTEGMEILPNHQFIIVGPYGDGQDKMKCTVYLKPSPWVKFWKSLRRVFKPISFLSGQTITEDTPFLLKNVDQIMYNNGWDDATISFQEITAAEVIPDNRTRRIHDEKQILSPDQLVRGKVIIYHGWHSGYEKTIPRRMVVLEGESLDNSINFLMFKGLFLNEDGTTWLFSPFLGDCSVTSYDGGYYNNLSYLTDTGGTMTEAEIKVALSKNKNK